MRMRRDGQLAHTDEIKTSERFQLENLKRKNLLEDTGFRVRIILKATLHIRDM
jgi:hypothetical protein